MTRPNLFLIGAPKCGTTSLAQWLAGHPAVYMSPVKEPQHFCTDFGYPDYRAPSDYLSLFDGARPTHPLVGEASATYLYSSVAVANIEACAERPRYVVLIRNPAAMAPALHEQLLFDGDEDVADFEVAWGLQAERRAGRSIPRRCRAPRFLQYEDACRLGKQIERLLGTVAADRVLIMTLDELGADPRAAWLATQRFLGLDDDGRTDFPVANRAKQARLPVLRPALRAAAQLRRSLGIPAPALFGLGRRVEAINTRERSREPLSGAMQRHLEATFSDEVTLLERLTGRDLSAWRAATRTRREHHATRGRPRP